MIHHSGVVQRTTNTDFIYNFGRMNYLDVTKRKGESKTLLYSQVILPRDVQTTSLRMSYRDLYMSYK